MKRQNILKLKRMGMDFWQGDPRTAVSDCGNYRLRAESITDKNGVVFGADFGMGIKYAFEDENGKKYRKPKIITETHLHADTWHYKKDEQGNEICVHYTAVERAVWESDLSYTLADILAFVNSVSVEQYTKIEIE